MIDYYKSDPWVKSSVDELADSLVGAGFYLTGENKDALGYAEEWVIDINLDGMLQTASRELAATGNWIAEVEKNLGDYQEIIPLPISSIKRFKTADIYGKIASLDQRRAGTWKKIPYDKCIHWAFNRIDASLWGCGLLEPLLRGGIGYVWKDNSGTQHTDYRPSLQSILEETHDSMRKALRRYIPRTVYVMLGYSDPAVTSHASKIGGMRPEDDLVIGAPSKAKQDIKIERVGTDPRSRLHPFIEHFHDGIITGTESANLKIAQGNVTEASARTLLDIQKWRISALRRFLKRKIEETILKPRVVQQMKWGRYTEAMWKKANIRVRWGIIEEPEIEVADLIRLAAVSGKYGIPYITPEELRKVLRKRGIEIEESIKIPTPEPKVEKDEEEEEEED